MLAKGTNSRLCAEYSIQHGDSSIVYLKFAENRSRAFSLKEKFLCEAMDMLFNLIAVIISQCVCISNHHIAQFKYVTILLVNYTSIKLWVWGEEKED